MDIIKNAPSPTRLLKVEVPIALHRGAKVEAAKRGSSLRQLVEEALVSELEKAEGRK